MWLIGVSSSTFITLSFAATVPGSNLKLGYTCVWIVVIGMEMEARKGSAGSASSTDDVQSSGESSRLCAFIRSLLVRMR